MHVCLGGLTLGHESRRLLTNGIVKPCVRDDRIFSAGPITAQPVPTGYLSTCRASTLHSNLSVIYPLLPDVHTCVNVSEYACVQHVQHVYGMHMRMSDFLSSSVIFTQLVQTGDKCCLNLFGCRHLFFSPELKK